MPTYAEEFLGEMSPAGRQAQQVLSPYQQFRASGTVRPPSEQSSIPDPEGAFQSLDPADDGFLDKATYVLQQAPDLAQRPDFQQVIRQRAREHSEAQTYFKEDPSLADFYAEQRAQGIAPDVALGALRTKGQDLVVKNQFLKSGGLLDEYETLRDPATGLVGKDRALDFLNRRDRDSKLKKDTAPKDLTPEAYSRIDKARQEAEDILNLSMNPESLKGFYLDKVKKKEWSEKNAGAAMEMVNQEIRRARNDYERLIQSYGREYKIPAEFGGQSEEPLSVAEQVQATSVPAQSPVIQPAPASPVAVMPPAPVQTTGVTQEDKASFLSRLRAKKQQP